MKTCPRKIRIAVPYTERMVTVPNCGFSSLAEALWNTRRDDCEVVKLHESALLARDDYDVIFFIRCGWFGENTVERCLAGEKPIAYWADDLHWFRWRVPYPPAKLISIFERADLIFVTCLHHFCQWKTYRRFMKKVVWCPWSVPDWIFEYSRPWDDRKDKVLLAGRCSAQYLLRRRLFKCAQRNGNSDIHVLHHPGYASSDVQSGTTGRDFHRLLGGYKGAIATTASTRIRVRRVIDYTVLKYFEIPACCCVPFMEVTPDLAELGFVDGLNYISITRWNYKKKMDFIHSREAEGVALAGQELVRGRHTHSHRVSLILDSIIRRLQSTACQDQIGSKTTE